MEHFSLATMLYSHPSACFYVRSLHFTNKTRLDNCFKIDPTQVCIATVSQRSYNIFPPPSIFLSFLLVSFLYLFLLFLFFSFFLLSLLFFLFFHIFPYFRHSVFFRSLFLSICPSFHLSLFLLKFIDKSRISDSFKIITS